MFRWGFLRDPAWSEFNRIQRNLDELARQLSGTRRTLPDTGWRASTIFPALNVAKSQDSFVVTAEIPGMNMDHMEISVEGDTLSLKGERKQESPGEGVSYHRRERAHGTFQRSLTLPSRVEAEEVKATYSNGVLTITLPLEKASKPKQISVSTE